METSAHRQFRLRCHSRATVNQRPRAVTLITSTGRTRLCPWRRSAAAIDTTPARCAREQWFVLHARQDDPGRPPPDLQLSFGDGRRLTPDWQRPLPIDAAPTRDWFAWMQAPGGKPSVALHAADATACDAAAVTLQAIEERDPKCHPHANVPRWSTYRTPFPIESVVLPESLCDLEPLLAPLRVQIRGVPRSLRDLARDAVGSACILDPRWVAQRGWTLAELEKLLPATWMLIDLESLAALVSAEHGKVPIVTRRSKRGLMSARVDYADVHTRGFALQDVLPYGTIDGDAAFSIRALRPSRDWKRYAAATGFAALLLSETPDPEQRGEVLSATRAVERGELIATDLPWLVAGRMGLPAAPRLARHLLRMHLGLPIADDAQYWKRWDDTRVVARDIADLGRRYGLRPVRWRAKPDGSTLLGLCLDALGSSAERTLILSSGSIDAGRGDGVPPEPLMILMKQLAREVRERSEWAAQRLGRVRLVWRFETHAGSRYATMYDAALPGDDAGHAVEMRVGDAESGAYVTDLGDRWVLRRLRGLLGDESLLFQQDLDGATRRWIERAALSATGS